MKKMKSVLAVALTFVTLAGLFTVLLSRGQTAQASLSLPGIEEIKKAGGDFNILEIVPEAGSGVIGWYAAGQEPKTVASVARAVTIPSGSSAKDARQSAVSSFLSGLEGNYLLGNSNEYPLTKVGAYAEVTPWARASGTAYQTLDLTGYETYTNVAGTFTAVTDGTGEYRADNSYALSSGGAGGSYDLDISGLSLYTSGSSSSYYYAPTGAFSPVETGKEVADGTLIFRQVNSPAEALIAIKKDTGGSYVYTSVDDTSEGVIYLTFEGAMGSSYLAGLNLTQTYYAVSCTVTSTASGTSPLFVPTWDGYSYVGVTAGTGHFDAVTESYTYVGQGGANADYSYAGSGSGSYTVKTRTVFYTGGFTNNDWFLKYVFNWDSGESAPNIKVTSVAEASATAAMVASADLIVLSGGLNSNAAASLSLGADVSSAIASVVTDKVPVLVDNRVRGSVTAAVSIGAASAVSKSVYCYTPASLGGSTFKSGIAGTHTSASDALYPVWYELSYENFLREQNDSTAARLDETVSIAACIRYVINYGGSRTVSQKNSIRVLDLEPGAGEPLTKAQVNSWTGISTSNITIDHYSTYEFIGKIDDLTETYDLIYVGADLTGFNTKGSGSNLKTIYNDDDMDGLIYTNIGDTWTTTSNKLTGLLDRDYKDNSITSDGYTRINAAWGTQANTYRFSGNDLTPGKYQELLNFAAAGYPVVVSDDLMTGTAGHEAFSFTAKVEDSDGNGILEASPVLESGSVDLTALTKTYKWYYRSGSSGNYSVISGAEASTYTPTEAGYYYCEITIMEKTARSNTVTVTDSSGLNYSHDNSRHTGWIYATSTTTYALSVTTSHSTRTGSNTYTVTSSPALPVGTTYQWYYWNYYSSQWLKAPGDNDNASYNTSYYHNEEYRCEVSVPNGTGVYATGSTRYYWWENGSFRDNASYYTSDPVVRTQYNTEFSPEISITSSAKTLTLTATTIPSIPVDRYFWYKDKEYYSSDSSITLNADDSSAGNYYCVIVPNGRWSSTNATSDVYTITFGRLSLTASTDQDATAVTVPGTEASLSVSTDTVDYNSYMYKFLSGVTEKSNIFITTDAMVLSGDTDVQTSLIQYLNLSKPEIVFSKDSSGSDRIPTVYTDTDSQMAGRTLSYTFTIKNDTEPDPASTRYYCSLYIDMDADGLYNYTEELADIAITDADGNTVRSGDLKAGIEYTVTRTMPDEYVGIIPWKLEVVKTADERVHASQTNYTRIAPGSDSQKTTIKILQILHSGNGSQLNLTTNQTYQNLFAQVTDFSINITTISATVLGNKGNVDTISDYFEGFDMLVLGFADAYQELNKSSAEAVADYISSGKAVLFTHDTTSVCNLPTNNYPTTNNGEVDEGSYYWGYYFNTLIRDAVGLDRYGVTSQKYGVTKYRTDIKTSANVIVDSSAINVASGSALTEAQRAALVSAGYSVAYQPDSGSTDAATVAEVQGVTYAAAINLTDAGQLTPTIGSNYYKKDGGNYLTTSVSQVNKGQITTYPFDINLKDFGSETGTYKNSDTLTIAPTHNQYYQLNMNADDIVVWYCLADGSSNKTSDDIYGYLPNDVTNNYYIYSVGNVTYSGAGHSGNNVSEAEAKLFVNTMIAAYQTAATAPEVSFVEDQRDADTSVSDVFFTADEAGVLADAPVYFTVTDPSIGSNKTLTATFTYGSTSVTLPIYIAGGNGIPVNGTDGQTKYTLANGVVYCVYPTRNSGIAAAIENAGNTDLSITVTSSLYPTASTAAVTLRRVGLFPLA